MEDFIVSAPGKVILHGEHAVVYGKTAVAASLNLRTYLHLSCKNQDKVVLDLPDIGILKSWTVEQIQQHISLLVGNVTEPKDGTEDQLQRLAELAGVEGDSKCPADLSLIAFLRLYTAIAGLSGKLPPMKIKVLTSLPISAGLGSSASFSVALVTALLLHQGLVKPQNGMATEDGSVETWSQSDLELINRWAFQGERIVHGNPSGVDNSVATFGGALNFKAGKITRIERMPALKIFLINTHIPRSTKSLVSNVRALHDKYPGVLLPVMEAVEDIAERCQQTYADMVTKETEEEEHYKTLEDLIDFNQHLLQVMGVSHMTVDKICQVTSKYGLHSKLTGAGGGGCTFTLLRPDTSQETIDNIERELQPDAFQCWDTVIGGAGVQLHDISKAGNQLPDGLL